jgi:hypothetical protein
MNSRIPWKTLAGAANLIKTHIIIKNTKLIKIFHKISPIIPLKWFLKKDIKIKYTQWILKIISEHKQLRNKMKWKVTKICQSFMG